MDILEILTDDRPMTENPLHEQRFAEHGLSIYFEKDGRKWLMDTGLTGQFAENAASSGIDISQVDHLVLSHNHNDHTGGLKTFLQNNSKALIHLSKWIRESTCFSMRENQKTDISLDRELTQQYASRFVWHLSENIQLTDHVWLLADIPAIYPLPLANENLLWNYNGKDAPDPFNHEMALLITGENANTVISSCTHRGILNTLEASVSVSKDPISAFVGGTHLREGHETEEDILNITSLIIEKHPQMHLYTGHCTGEQTLMVLKRFLPGHVTAFYSGFKTMI
ncbi:MAG: MBL fold metallo-hydrolase [Bacteroidales bacterium]|jgi:7,8-dihydropterin-6-yl-methyl-4-(beta-D-ribofuranosyl)aminobenzene 5'-phosphate synthase